MKKVLLTGVDGYCGWPILLRLLKKEYRVVGIDNAARRSWVNEVKSKSVIPIADITTRTNKAKSFGNYEFYYADIADYSTIHGIIEQFKPEIVIHVAAQPSAPYAGMDVHHCNYTQQNNTQMLRNILWALHNVGLHDTHLIVTTTTGIYGAPDFDIPEGNIVINKDELPFPSMGGSWYHMSRAHDAANLWLASKQFKFPITELRTAIVCGSSTEETLMGREFRNRFDVDSYFGVVVHRFVAQALSTKHLSVYGKGLQRKPMISLEDMVSSTVACCNLQKEKEYEIFNQTDKPIAIVEIAERIKKYCEKLNIPIHIDHIPNPRIEDEEHQMVMHNEQFVQKLCGGKIRQSVDEAIDIMCRDLQSFTTGLAELVRR